MDRKRIQRQQYRRYSLPVTSSLTPLGYSRAVPEGSDTFQKALEQLYADEPNQAPSTQNNGFALSGLNNIQEGNESDFVESEEELDEDSELLKISRRHSSPSCFVEDDEQLSKSSDARKSKMKKEINSAVKSHTKLRKDYFVKYGRWPVVNTLSDTKGRPSSYHGVVRKPGGTAFGSSRSLQSKMAKLRV